MEHLFIKILKYILFISWTYRCIFSLSAPTLPPKIKTSFSPASTNIFLEWEDLPKIGWNGESLGYKVKYKKYFDSEFQEKRIDYGFTATLLEDLKPFTLHWIDICAFNSAGEGPVSYSIKKTLEGGNFFLIIQNVNFS